MLLKLWMNGKLNGEFDFEEPGTDSKLTTSTSTGGEGLIWERGDGAYLDHLPSGRGETILACLPGRWEMTGMTGGRCTKNYPISQLKMGSCGLMFPRLHINQSINIQHKKIPMLCYDSPERCQNVSYIYIGVFYYFLMSKNTH